MPSDELFNVHQFFPDGSNEMIGENLTVEEALTRARDYVRRPAATIGIIQEVRVVDSGDQTVFHWVFEKGIVFPHSPAITQWNTAYKLERSAARANL